MAEKNIPEPNDTAVRVKRRLKNPSETIRQQSVKHHSVEDSTAPKTHGSIWLFLSGFFWPLRMLGRGIAKLNRFKIFRGIGLVVLPRYIRDSWRELRRVTWTTRRQTWDLTYAVLVFSVLFGAVVFVIDFGLDKLFKEFILK